MLLQAILVSLPGSCEPICGLPLNETSQWVFHSDSDAFQNTTLACVLIKTSYPLSLPYRNCLLNLLSIFNPCGLII